MPSSRNEPTPRLLWSDFVHELSALLRRAGADVPLYIVGGAPRDACLGLPITDIDIAVAGDAPAIARRVANALDADIYVMDAERGVARVFVGTGPGAALVDFARFRGAALADDLRDRDFTINAMAVDLHADLAQLIDPLGGARDLRDKILRPCSSKSIAADPIRALRAVRLCAQMGLKMHPETIGAIRQDGSGIASASPERIRDEFFKLLSLEAAARATRVLWHLDLLPQILPWLAGDALSRSLLVMERMSAILTCISERRTDSSAAAFDLGMLAMQLDRFRAPLQQRLDIVYGSGRRHAQLMTLAALLHDKAERARVIARSLRLSADEEKRLGAMIGGCRQLLMRQTWTDLDRHRYWHQLRESGIDALLLSAAVYLGTRGAALEQADWLRIVENMTVLLDGWFNRRGTLVDPPTLLGGNELMQLLEIKRGPRVGQLLRALREAQVTGAVRTVEEARDFLRRANLALE